MRKFAEELDLLETFFGFFFVFVIEGKIII